MKVVFAVIDVVSAAPSATTQQLLRQLGFLGAAMLGSCIGLTGQASTDFRLPLDQLEGQSCLPHRMR